MLLLYIVLVSHLSEITSEELEQIGHGVCPYCPQMLGTIDQGHLQQ